MTKPILHEDKIHLQEGFAYEFMILDKVMLQDHKEYFILSDPNRMKHFLEASPYANYPMAKMSRISCLVSKINCTGRIFLEPEHPKYKIGEIYQFQVFSNDSQGNLDEIEIGDLLGSRWVLKLDHGQKYSATTIQCLIISFKKGIPEIKIL